MYTVLKIKFLFFKIAHICIVYFYHTHFPHSLSTPQLVFSTPSSVSFSFFHKPVINNLLTPIGAVPICVCCRTIKTVILPSLQSSTALAPSAGVDPQEIPALPYCNLDCLDLVQFLGR